MSSLDFEILNQEHFKQILVISDKCFGEKYLSGKQLEDYCLPNGLSIILKLKGKIIGFCLNQIVKKPNRQNGFLKTAENGEFPAGIIKTIAIDPKFQQQGYGSKLLDLSVSKLARNEVKTIFYPAWNENNCERFLLKLRKINFIEVTIIPSYWNMDSVKNNYHCKRCGPPPCNCSLTLYKLTLTQIQH